MLVMLVRDVWLTGGTGTGFDREVYVGTPLCVQVVAPRLEEERLVAAMRAVDEAVKGGRGIAAKL